MVKQNKEPKKDHESEESNSISDDSDDVESLTNSMFYESKYNWKEKGSKSINKDIHKETNRNQGPNIKPEKILPDSILLYEKDSFSSKLTSNLSYFKKDLKETQDRNKKAHFHLLALKLKLDQILFQEKLTYIDRIE